MNKKHRKKMDYMETYMSHLLFYISIIRKSLIIYFRRKQYEKSMVSNYERTVQGGYAWEDFYLVRKL